MFDLKDTNQGCGYWEHVERVERDHERWLELDARFGTSPESPLHHDARCVMCHGWNVG